ncbi:SRPBCC family protein [Pseudarthrobacter sp. Fe7]|nr:SRPBCC family protein [Pseudarthrobacter sp. Fe7]
MTRNILQSTVIKAPVDTVFTFLSDPTNWMTAFPGDSDVTNLDIKPDGVGTSARWSAKTWGIPMHVTHEYRDVVPNKRIVSKASVGPVITFSLEPVNGSSTELTVEPTLEFDAPLVRVPVQALWARWTEDDIKGMVANVKSLVETGKKTAPHAPESKIIQTLTWSDSITIAAPVQEVFDLVNDPQVWLGPDVQISDLRTTPGGVGTTFQAAWKVLGFPLKTTHEYTEYVPNSHFTSKAALGPVFKVEVAPEDGGTRLGIRSDTVPRNMAEAAVDALVIKMSERGQAEQLAGIKAKAESRAGTQ